MFMKRWNKEEENRAVEMLKSGLGYKEISDKLNRTYRSIKNKLNNLGYTQSDYNVIIFYEHVMCLECGDVFESLKSESRKFCSKSCSATFNNKGVIRNYSNGYYSVLDYNKPSKKIYSPIVRCTTKRYVESICVYCNENIVGYSRPDRKYCSGECSTNHRKEIKNEQIENGEISHPRTLRRYLIEKNGHSCNICGICDWMNELTPLVLDHINGNSDNNFPNNLRLICPNCDAQTDTYKGKNRGNGRHKRMKRYYDGKSY